MSLMGFDCDEGKQPGAESLWRELWIEHARQGKESSLAPQPGQRIGMESRRVPAAAGASSSSILTGSPRATRPTNERLTRTRREISR